MNPCCLGDIFKIHFNQYHFDVSGALIETYDAGVYDVLINDNTQIEFYRAIVPNRGPRFYMHFPCFISLAYPGDHRILHFTRFDKHLRCFISLEFSFPLGMTFNPNVNYNRFLCDVWNI